MAVRVPPKSQEQGDCRLLGPDADKLSQVVRNQGEDNQAGKSASSVEAGETPDPDVCRSWAETSDTRDATGEAAATHTRDPPADADATHSPDKPRDAEVPFPSFVPGDSPDPTHTRDAPGETDAKHTGDAPGETDATHPCRAPLQLMILDSPGEADAPHFYFNPQDPGDSQDGEADDLADGPEDLSVALVHELD